MNKFTEFIENRIMPFAGKVGSQRHLLAVRRGMLLSMPLIIIGSLFLIIGNLPFTGWTDWLHANGQLDVWLGKLVNGSFGLMGLVASFGIAYNLADSYDTDGAAAGVLALSSYLILTPYTFGPDKSPAISYSYMSSSGLFVAILVGLITADIFRRFLQKDIIIKMPEGVPPEVSRSFAALLPGIVIITSWGIIQKVIELSPFNDVFNVIMTTLGIPLGFLGGTLPGTILAVGLTSLFWFAGISGGDIVGSIMNPIWLQNAGDNLAAFQSHAALPHIITYSYVYNFIFIGGGGATLAFVALLMLRGKSNQSKMIGRLAFAPGIFNINEPVLFGLPIVLNPVMIFPFILVPMVNATVTYFTMSIGLVAKTAGVVVPWTTPPIISGYLATGGQISGAILQIALLAINVVLYYPFFKAMDLQNLKAEKKLQDA